ncbi:MAG: type III-A CRISPR-associated RAMP protein Csm3 [Hymenobacteraceae bacterium]|nr:type III-A CRISPR-associated RAMP protein Csm3 [Hymenobacteraceae bacterium]MDX5396585.1 type III-A CRISPR-associated RAMP protein Csm3 [Hymenobacteraceae bacterium]MDX5512648.1 type III-A CRISPR-associated RAMP protein Csm3 [Hymenobacteraceae bacterium]
MTKLIKKILIEGKVKAVTGLMIGGSNTAMAIGGPDKVVIRNPVTNQPYIPGSSLKGKMRSLMEVSYGYIGRTKMGKVENGPDNTPGRITSLLFGTANNEVDKQRPSRIIVRDGQLQNAEFLLKFNTDLPFTEAKTEVVIDRITSAAMPRTFERVPAGAEFNLSLVLNIFEDDKQEKELLEHTLRALLMVQDDYLGGSGSRGSGQVKFEIEKVTERPASFYHGDNQAEKDITKDAQIPDALKPGSKETAKVQLNPALN